MTRHARWGALILLLPFAACASNSPPPAPAIPPAPPPLASADASFVQTAAQGGMAEIAMAKLAEQKSHSRAVRHFAEKMVTDHTAADQQLQQIAQTKGAVVPTSVDDEQQAALTKLQGESGRTFDRDYIDGQVKDHEAMLSAFQTEESSGSDADLKKFAADTIPVIQEHLDMAKKLEMGGHHRMMHHHHHSAS